MAEEEKDWAEEEEGWAGKANRGQKRGGGGIQETNKVPLGGDTLSGTRAVSLVVRCVRGLSDEDKGQAGTCLRKSKRQQVFKISK